MTDVFSNAPPRRTTHVAALVLCVFGLGVVFMASGCPSPRTPTPVGCVPFSQACINGEPMVCDENHAYHPQGNIPCPFGQVCESNGRVATCVYPDASTDAADAAGDVE